MSTPMDVHAAAESILLPGDVAAHPVLPVVAWTLAGPQDRRLMLLDLEAAAQPVDISLPGAPDPAVLRWATPELLLAAVGGDGNELTDLVGIRVDLAAGAPVAGLAWRHRLPGAIEDIRPGPAGHLVLLAEPGSERDGSHLGTRVGPLQDPIVDRTDHARRRLVVVGPDGQQRDVDTGGSTVWSADWDGGTTVVAVVSDDPRQAGFYTPRLVRLGLSDDSMVELYSTSWQLAQPRLSPDGRTALVVEGLSIVSGRVVTVELATAAAQHWDSIDDVTDLGWLDDERVWLAGWADTGSFAGVTDPAGSWVTKRWTGAVSLRGADGQPTLAPTAGGVLVSVAESDVHGPELVTLEPDQPTLTLLTGVNNASLGLAAGIRRTVISWESGDGVLVDGLLLVPEAAGDAAVPLVVVAHGGPTWVWTHALSPAESYNVALPLVHAGAAVLLPNPRGSSGRGQDFARSVIGNAGICDLDDVLQGVATLVERGVADPDRIGMLGLSYGGYLAAMASTTPSPVRAAVVLSGVADWLSFATTSNLGGTYDRLYHRGLTPTTAAGRDELAAVSPVYLATQDASPTLVLHSRDDRTTPIGQGEMLHRALRQAGATAELVTYPDEGHELVDPAHRRDAAERILAWLAQHGVLA